MNNKIIIISLMFAIVFFAIFIIAVGTFIESKRINEESIDKKLEIAKAGFEARGVEPEQIEIALKAQEQEYMDEASVFWTRWLPIFVAFIALFISGISQAWNVYVELLSRRAKLEVWQRNEFFKGSDDDRTRINLIFRNKSYRPAAIVELYIRDKSESIMHALGYRNRIKLPIQIDPWNVVQRTFRIEKDDEKQMKDILMRDIDDNEIIIDRSRKGDKWEKTIFRKKKKGLIRILQLKVKNLRKKRV